MCKPNKTILPSVGGFLRMFPTAMSVVALGLLCSLPSTRASAQPCLKCPDNASGAAGAAGLNVFVFRNGQFVSVASGFAGACEELLILSEAKFSGDGGTDPNNVPLVAPAAAGGKGLLTLRNGRADAIVTNVTPADMGST